MEIVQKELSEVLRSRLFFDAVVVLRFWEDRSWRYPALMCSKVLLTARASGQAFSRDMKAKTEQQPLFFNFYDIRAGL